jgi:uncharacterized ferritin-like protein (DUF455 family)/nitrite reductase/ring-hydroxylating ferredoxin subunit
MFQKVAPIADWQNGLLRASVTLKDKQVLFIFQHQEAFYAIESACPHSGGPLHLADIEELDNDCTAVITCPWHEYQFAINTGTCTNHDFKAETFPVHVVDSVVHLTADSKISNIEFYNVSKRNVASSPVLFSHPPTTTEKSLIDWAIHILHTPNAKDKMNLTLMVAEKWKNGYIILGLPCETVPDRPLRSDSLQLIQQSKAKKWKNGGSITSRVAILHSLANVEQWAIDLAWDIICRFANFQALGKTLPKAFFDDFVKVAADEAKHFGYLVDRLGYYDTQFGDLPVHEGLWESASSTSHDILARLAIVHMVHEARGLDVNPSTISKFLNNGDLESAEKLKSIHEDEITVFIPNQACRCRTTVVFLDLQY